MTTPIDIEAAEKRLREAMQQSPADFALDCFPVIRSLVAQLRDARAELGRLAEAVRVLGEECRAWRSELHKRQGDGGGSAVRAMFARQDAVKATDSHPTARASLNGEAPIDSDGAKPECQERG